MGTGGIRLRVAAASGIFGACRWLDRMRRTIGKQALAAATRTWTFGIRHPTPAAPRPMIRTANRLTRKCLNCYCLWFKPRWWPVFWGTFCAGKSFRSKETTRQMQGSERFEQIALPHLDSVYRAAVALCGRSDDAEDLTQATFARALERFHTFEAGTNCKAWLFQIMRNIRIDHLRHRKVAGNSVPLDEELAAHGSPGRADRVVECPRICWRIFRTSRSSAHSSACPRISD